MGSIPGQGRKILQAAGRSQKKRKKEEKKCAYHSPVVLDMKNEMKILLEGNHWIGGYHCDLGVGQDILTHTKAITIKIKSFCSSKCTIMRMKRQATEREKLSAKPLSDKEFIPRTC